MHYLFNFDKLSYVKGEKPHGCILCLIRDKSEDVIDLSVYEDSHFIATVNLYPYNPAHVMIFPNRHIVDVREFTEAEDRRRSILVRHFVSLIERTHAPSGFNIGYNMGAVAGASIDHLHLHVMPRYPREIGIADLVAGQRVLIEDPRVTQERLTAELSEFPVP